MKELKAYYRAVERLREIFLEKYFDEDPDFYWVGDQIGGVLFVNDFFFSVENIIVCLKLKIKSEDLFSWYDYIIDQAMVGKIPISLGNWMKLQGEIPFDKKKKYTLDTRIKKLDEE